MAAHKSATKNHTNDSTLVNVLLVAVVALVALLLAGGYWMQKQRAEDFARYERAHVYENYLQSTRPSAKAPVHEPPRSYVQAREMRQQLLAHPAVTPGTGFDKPGVQATGKAIVDAIDQAKGL